MGKAKKIGIGIGIAVAAFFAIVIAAAASIPPNVTTNSDRVDVPDILAKPIKPVTNSDRIVGIGKFTIMKQSSFYQVHFTLVDKNLTPLATDAKIQLALYHNDLSPNYQEGSQRALYSSIQDIKASDFRYYDKLPYGIPTDNVYLWLIERSDVGVSLDYGKAVLIVTLDNGKTFTADTNFFF